MSGIVRRMSEKSHPTACRRPRFKRQDPLPFAPTDDDRMIVRHLAEHRFLRSTHLVQLLARPSDKIVRRLALLYHNGYLDRPRAQRKIFGQGANAPLIYALGQKSSRLFGALDSIDWAGKNRSVTEPYIEHALMTADFMVALECAVRSQPAVRLLRAADIADDVRRATGLEHHSWTMTTHVPDEDIEIGVVPDKVFALEFTNTGRRNYFLLEADRSTMPVDRASLAQSSFKKKLLAYHLAHQAKRHVALWGIPGFRVLTITKSTERIESMIAVLKSITGGKGSNVFLFARLQTILQNDPLGITWRSGKDLHARLLAPDN